jgi:hypothetical protein
VSDLSYFVPNHPWCPDVWAGGQAGPELGGPVPPTCANETGMLPSSAAAASMPVVPAARPRGRRAGRQGMTPTTVTGVTKTVIAYPN